MNNSSVFSKDKIVRDGVTYDLSVTAQATAYEDAYGASGWAEKLRITPESSGNKKAYYSGETTAPTHPVRTDFGYEKLESGSTIYQVNGGNLYMYDEFSEAWVAQ